MAGSGSRYCSLYLSRWYTRQASLRVSSCGDLGRPQIGLLASVEYAQCRIGSAHGLCSQSQGGSDTIDHLAGASVEHLTATNFIAGTKAKPGTKGGADSK
jgi:hypothetical protein